MKNENKLIKEFIDEKRLARSVKHFTASIYINYTYRYISI